MSWLRVDDKFVRHPKVASLSRGDRWTWLEVLSYCAEYQTDGHVPATISVTVSHAKPFVIERFHRAGLLDKLNGIYVVHNWGKYNPKDPTKAERQARWRHKRDGDVDASVDTDVDTDVDGRVDALARARPVPVPSQGVLGTSTEDLTQGRKEARPPAREDHAERPGDLQSIGEIIDASLASVTRSQQ